MRRKKDCKVYTDSDFPNYIFCKFGNELKVFSEVSYYNSKQRDIDHYWLKPKNWNGKTRKAISVQRIEAAMEIERDVLDVRYVYDGVLYDAITKVREEDQAISVTPFEEPNQKFEIVE